MFLFLQSKLGALLKILTAVGIAGAVLSIFWGKWAFVTAGLTGASLLVLLIRTIDPGYSIFNRSTNKLESHPIDVFKNFEQIKPAEELLLKKWQRKVCLIEGIMFGIPGVLLQEVRWGVIGFILGYLSTLLLLKGFLAVSRKQAMKRSASLNPKVMNDLIQTLPEPVTNPEKHNAVPLALMNEEVDKNFDYFSSPQFKFVDLVKLGLGLLVVRLISGQLGIEINLRYPDILKEILTSIAWTFFLIVYYYRKSIMSTNLTVVLNSNLQSIMAFVRTRFFFWYAVYSIGNILYTFAQFGDVIAHPNRPIQGFLFQSYSLLTMILSIGIQGTLLQPVWVAILYCGILYKYISTHYGKIVACGIIVTLYYLFVSPGFASMVEFLLVIYVYDKYKKISIAIAMGMFSGLCTSTVMLTLKYLLARVG